MPASLPDDGSTIPRATVYFDGDCPLCSVEIAYYRRQKGAKALDFVDVSAETALECADLTREEALQRFHIRNSGGKLISGAAAFVELWRLLPRWSWAARIASLPGVALEMLYRLFLRGRPALARSLSILGIGGKTTSKEGSLPDQKQSCHLASVTRHAVRNDVSAPAFTGSAPLIARSADNHRRDRQRGLKAD